MFWEINVTGEGGLYVCMYAHSITGQIFDTISETHLCLNTAASEPCSSNRMRLRGSQSADRWHKVRMAFREEEVKQLTHALKLCKSNLAESKNKSQNNRFPLNIQRNSPVLYSCFSPEVIHTSLETKDRELSACWLSNTHFLLVTSGCQVVTDWSQGLCDWVLSHLIIHCDHDCHTSKMIDKLTSHG